MKNLEKYNLMVAANVAEAVRGIVNEVAGNEISTEVNDVAISDSVINLVALRLQATFVAAKESV